MPNNRTIRVFETTINLNPTTTGTYSDAGTAGVGGAQGLGGNPGGQSATGTGGAGGNFTISGGDGGMCSGAGTGGAGGAVVLEPGSGGTTSGGTNGVNGIIRLNGTITSDESITDLGVIGADTDLTASQFRTGILLAQTGAPGWSLRLPQSDAIASILPSASSGDVFTFTVVETGANDLTINPSGTEPGTVNVGGIRGNNIVNSFSSMFKLVMTTIDRTTPANNVFNLVAV